MKINKNTLLVDLEMVKPGLSAREFIEQSSCFVFQDGMVMTFNDEISCRKKTELNGMKGAVQAATLLEILEKLPDDHLDVVENEKGELQFRGKKKQFAVIKDAEIFLPIDRVEKATDWRKIPSGFTEAVRLVHHCVSSDESRFMLTCIHAHPKYLEACDNIQAMRHKIKTGLDEPILIRGDSLKHVLSLELSYYAVTKSWVHFKGKDKDGNDGLILSCRKYLEDYPPLDGIMNFEGHKIVIPKGISEAADRASVFAVDKSDDTLVSVRVTADKVVISGEGLTGWYKEMKKVSYDGPNMDFMIAPELLKYITEHGQDAQITDDKLKVVGGKWEYVTVLSRKKEKSSGGSSNKKNKKSKKTEEDEE